MGTQQGSTTASARVITVHTGSLREPFLKRWEAELLAALHTTEWNSGTTPEMMLRRLTTFNPFITLSDRLTEEDVGYVREVYGLQLSDDQRALAPVGLAQTIRLRTEGQYERVPKTIDELTNNGHWKFPPKEYDTGILVDITLLPTRRGKKDGSFQHLTATAIAALAQLFPETSYVWTYSPNIPKVLELHKFRGASDTGYELPNGRPSYEIPSVRFMDYTGILKTIKDANASTHE